MVRTRSAKLKAAADAKAPPAKPAKRKLANPALADDLSAYEHQRNANIADNQRKLRELFGADAPRLAKKSAPRRAPRTAAPPAEPSRSSTRVQSKEPVSYTLKKRKRSDSDSDSDDGEGDSSNEDESGEEYEGSDVGSSSGDEACTDEEGGGKAGGKAKARGGKAKARG